MKKKRVLLVGLRASSVDFSKWPNLSPDKLQQAFNAVEEELHAAGFEARWCLTDDGVTAEAELLEALQTFTPDIVSIGAGVRTDPDLLPLFERMINLVHEEAPHAKFVFNTDPMNTIASVKRIAAE